MWKLVIEDDEGKRTVVPLNRDQYTVGRRDGNSIRLTERNVSREHARLFKKNGVATEKATFAVEDLTSYNGVFVNGLRVTHAQDLSHGDLVQIGDYRIVLEDETTADAVSAEVNEIKQTVPSAPQARAMTLLDRPNRLVMLAGPAPGAEFPLDRERLSIGRAEDAGISVNHNSVSRFHCEVHAIGDGRFEIVDKGSSNGVRVNGADLRRGIVEPGDLIELGDVKFKFVGAGQIFRPTESQKLAAITDRAASDLIRGRRTARAVPMAIFAAVVVAGGVVAWLYSRPHSERAAAIPVALSPEQVALDEAKKLCGAGDCEGAHAKLETAIAQTSPLRDTKDFRDVENKWADQLLERAGAEDDLGAKRKAYERVSRTITVDAMRRKIAADKLQQLDMVSANPAQLPQAGARPAPDEAAPPPPRPEGTGRRSAGAQLPASPPQLEMTTAATMLPVASPAPLARSTGANMDDRERQLALQGTQDSKALLKQQLEQRVSGGKASETEIRLLISTCKDLGDKACVQQARASLAQRQQ